MQMADIVQIKHTKRRSVVPIAEFEALFSQLRQALHPATVGEVMEHLGYAGGSHLAEWRKKGNAPVLAINAAKGVLAELRVAPQARVVRPFSTEELSRIFALCVGIDIPPEQKGPLLAKLAKELTDASSTR
jgi:hypothetical protein